MTRNGALSVAAIRQALESIYRQRPANLAEQLSPVQKSLTAHRDRLRREIRHQDSLEDQQSLNKLNQALSLIHAAAYPGAEVRWDALPGIGELLENLS
jgi:hypothetical protein